MPAEQRPTMADFEALKELLTERIDHIQKVFELSDQNAKQALQLANSELQKQLGEIKASVDGLIKSAEDFQIYRAALDGSTSRANRLAIVSILIVVLFAVIDIYIRTR